jgi:hypothetical protein
MSQKRPFRSPSADVTEGPKARITPNSKDRTKVNHRNWEQFQTDTEDFADSVSELDELLSP